jgi:hypothetical protein
VMLVVFVDQSEDVAGVDEDGIRHPCRR